jgi:hypothetical protein
MFVELIEPKPKSKFANNGTLSQTKRTKQLRYQYRANYGLTLDEVKELKEGNCEICGTHAKKMVIDHEHGTKGTYRGVLCQQCNVRLGWFEKNQAQINHYLKKDK